jgi:hypothetical protein
MKVPSIEFYWKPSSGVVLIYADRQTDGRMDYASAPTQKLSWCSTFECHRKGSCHLRVFFVRYRVFFLRWLIDKFVSMYGRPDPMDNVSACILQKGTACVRWRLLAAEITWPETDVKPRGRSGKEQGGNDPEDSLQCQLPLPILRVGNTRRLGIEMIQSDYKNILS